MRMLSTISFFVAMAPLLALILLGQSGIAALLHNPVWVAAMLRTLLIAEATVPIALLLAVPAGLAMWGVPPGVRRPVIAMCALPILLPPSWTASGLEFAAERGGIVGAHVAALIAAHAVPAASLAFLVFHGIMRLADPALLRVASASGASPLRAWRIAVLPHAAMAVVVAAAVAFAASVGLSLADTVLAPAYHPTLGVMLTVAVHTADSQAAAAGLLLALLAMGPIGVVGCLALLRRW